VGARRRPGGDSEALTGDGQARAGAGEAKGAGYAVVAATEVFRMSEAARDGCGLPVQG
jgi:hypothetical protein